MVFRNLRAIVQSMYNFHVGLPGIIPNLLNTMLETGFLAQLSDVSFLSRKIWQEKFRKLINETNKRTFKGEHYWQSSAEEVDALSVHGGFSISIPDLMGKAEHCFEKARPLPYAETRIENVCQILSGKPITFHLTIMSQYDYLVFAAKQLSVDLKLSQIHTVPSWSDLAQRLRVASGGAQVVVWDFEQPKKVILTFLIDFLNVHDEDDITKLANYLSKSTNQNDFAGSNSPTMAVEGQDLSIIMDEQYEIDLEAIRQIEGVKLYTPENISREYFLRR